MSNHANETAAHRPFAAVYTDATARTAATGFPRGESGAIIAFASADLNKQVLQQSDNTIWILTATTPTWVQVGGAGVGFASDAGSTDTYAATLSPAPSAYVTGQAYRFKANTANTGACTINFNSLGAKTIKKVAGGITTDLADNDIRAGQWVDVVYDGTNMQMQSTLGNAAAGGGGGSGIDAFFPLTAPPTLTNWTWVNQGTATAGDYGASVILTALAASGDDLKMLKRSAPGSTPYQVTAGVILQGIALNYALCGIIHRSSSDNRVTALAMDNDGLKVFIFTSSTSTGSVVASNYPARTSFAGAGPVLWLRMRDDGTNRIYSWSTNGRVFTQLYSVARTTHHTPDEIGFVCETNQIQFPVTLCLLSWNVENV
jgi:hypothetical protein